MLTRSHTWSRSQKWLIITASTLATVAVATLVFTYERYNRGPGEEILYGTWEGMAVNSDDPVHIHLKRGGTFSVGWDADEQFDPGVSGKWYAGGKQIYLQFRRDPEPHPVVILHIVDIEGDQLRIRYTKRGAIYTYRRIHRDSANASNQAMQRTA